MLFQALIMLTENSPLGVHLLYRGVFLQCIDLWRGLVCTTRNTNNNNHDYHKSSRKGGHTLRVLNIQQM